MTHKIRTIGEIVYHPTPLPIWLFEGFLRHQTLTVLGADRHSGKTLIMLDMMICLEMGLPLFGLFPPAQCQKVLFIGQDAPTWDYEEMIRKLLAGHGIEREVGELFEGRTILNDGVDMTDPKFWEPEGYGTELLAEWNDQQFDVLMLDTELEMHSMEENAAQDMKRWGRIKKSLRDRLRVSVITSHHLSHPNDPKVPRRLRGSTTLGGTVDYEILLSPVGGLTENPRIVEMGMNKARGGFDAAKWPGLFQIHQEPGKVWLTAPKPMVPNFGKIGK